MGSVCGFTRPLPKPTTTAGRVAWWKARLREFPSLAPVAIAHLLAPRSATQAERTFSCLRHIQTDDRLNVTNETLLRGFFVALPSFWLPPATIQVKIASCSCGWWLLIPASRPCWHRCVLVVLVILVATVAVAIGSSSTQMPPHSYPYP
eukprot:GGOE01029271.1.p1 GENE.GGOE01029271.1~~GGOE01029271.1.p1  ORF type:complete len:149 (+),score=9.30 GGOE01029271.1:254-700(+)